MGKPERPAQQKGKLHFPCKTAAVGLRARQNLLLGQNPLLGHPRELQHPRDLGTQSPSSGRLFVTFYSSQGSFLQGRGPLSAYRSYPGPSCKCSSGRQGWGWAGACGAEHPLGREERRGVSLWEHSPYCEHSTGGLQRSRGRCCPPQQLICTAQVMPSSTPSLSRAVTQRGHGDVSHL